MKTITRLTLAFLLATSFALVGCGENKAAPDSGSSTSESDAGGGSESAETEGGGSEAKEDGSATN